MVATSAYGLADLEAEGTYTRRIFDLFVPATTTAGADPNAPAPSARGRVEGVDVTSKAGLFFSEADGRPLRLGVEHGRLRFQGGPPLDAVAFAGTTPEPSWGSTTATPWSATSPSSG